MCMCFVGVCARARVCVCSSVHLDSFRYGNYIQGMCMFFVVFFFFWGGGGARVCTTLYWGCLRYDNYTQGMQLCVCIL